MARLRRLDGDLHRFEIAHFAHEHDVRIFAQRRAQSAGEALRVAVHLALVDHALEGLVDELDGVLDRDDVLGAAAVDRVDEGRERRGLAAAGGTGDDDEALREVAELPHRRRQREILERGNPLGDDAHYAAEPEHVAEAVHAEAGDTGDFVGAVRVPVQEELLVVLLGEDLLEDAEDLVARVAGLAVDRAERAVDAYEGAPRGAHVQVAAVPRHQRFEIPVDRRHVKGPT